MTNNRSIYFAITAALASLATLSCSKVDDSALSAAPSGGAEMTISTKSSGSFVTSDELIIENFTMDAAASYIYDGSVWSSDSPLVWPDDLDTPIELMAYLSLEGASSKSITLGAAGSTIYQQDALSASDYLYYYTPSALKGSSNSIDIALDHMMAKVIVSVSVGNSGDVVNSLSVLSPSSMTFDGGEWGAGQEELTVVAHNESTTYTLYVAPHTWSEPAISLNTNEGVLVASYDNAIELAAGKEYSVAIRTSTEGLSAEFVSDFTVKEWGAATDLGATSSAIIWDGSVEVNDSYGGGSGTADDPYLISTPAQLAYLSQYVYDEAVAAGAFETTTKKTSYSGKYFEITADMDLNNIPWTPIGTGAYSAFGGNVEGGGHTIYNLNIDTTADDIAYAGLFGSYTAATGGYLRNLTLDGATIVTVGQHAGALIGYSQNNLSMSGCHVVNSSVSNTSGNSKKYLGGMVGTAFQYLNNFTSCSVTNTTVQSVGGSNHFVGGFTGQVKNGVVFLGCVISDVTVINTTGYTGGFAGCTTDAVDSSSVTKFVGCSVSAAVDGGASYVGGIIASASSKPLIAGCYSTASLSGSSYIGSLMGAAKVEGEFSELGDIIVSSYATWQDGSAVGVVYSDTVSSALDGDTIGSMRVREIGADQLAAMNSAVADAGYEYQYVASSEYENLPYVLEPKN